MTMRVVCILVIVLLCACSSERSAVDDNAIKKYVDAKNEFYVLASALSGDIGQSIAGVQRVSEKLDQDSVEWCKYYAGYSISAFQMASIKALQVTLDMVLVELVAAKKSGIAPQNHDQLINGMLGIVPELKAESRQLVESGLVLPVDMECVMRRWDDIEKLSEKYPAKIMKDIGTKQKYDRYAECGQTLQEFRAQTEKLYRLSATMNKQFRASVIEDMKPGHNCYDAVQMGLMFRGGAILVVAEGMEVGNAVYGTRNKQYPGMQDMVATSLADVSTALKYFEQVDAYIRTLQDRVNYIGFLNAGRDFLETYAAWKRALLATLEAEGLKLPS